jgi:hypothetical protein
MPRSGTTLLSRMLDAHPDVVMSPETHYFTRCYTGSPVQDRDDALRMLNRLFQQPGVHDMRLTEEEQAAIRDRVRQGRAPTHGDVLRAVVEAFAARDDGACVWGEKTPDHLRFVPEMARQFPEAVFIAIVRDPRDVCLSHQSVPWNRDTLPEQAWTWRTYADRIQQYRADYAERFHDLRYEDLLVDPKQVLRDMCDRLHLPFDDRMLAFHQQDERSLDADREPWKQKSRRAVDPSNREKWRTQMPDADRVIVEAIVQDRLAAFGYPRSDVQMHPTLIAQILRRLWQAALRALQRMYRRAIRSTRDDAAPTWMHDAS